MSHISRTKIDRVTNLTTNSGQLYDPDAFSQQQELKTEYNDIHQHLINVMNRNINQSKLQKDRSQITSATPSMLNCDNLMTKADSFI